MKTLLTIMVLTNVAKSPNIAVPARLAFNPKSRVFSLRQAGLLIFATLLHRQIADHPSSAFSLFRRSVLFLKGNRHGNSDRHFMYCSSARCGGNCRSGFPADVEKSLSGLPCPEFKRIADITVNLTKWMKFVKIKISGAKKCVI